MYDIEEGSPLPQRHEKGHCAKFNHPMAKFKRNVQKREDDPVEEQVGNRHDNPEDPFTMSSMVWWWTFLFLVLLVLVFGVILFKGIVGTHPDSQGVQQPVRLPRNLENMSHAEYAKNMRPGDITIHNNIFLDIMNVVPNLLFSYVSRLPRNPTHHVGVVVFNPYYGEEYKNHSDEYVRRIWDQKYAIFHNDADHGNVLSHINSSIWGKTFTSMQVRRLQTKNGESKTYTETEIKRMKQYVLKNMNIPFKLGLFGSTRWAIMLHRANWMSVTAITWCSFTALNLLKEFNLIPSKKRDGVNADRYWVYLPKDFQKDLRAAKPYIYSKMIEVDSDSLPKVFRK